MNDILDSFNIKDFEKEMQKQFDFLRENFTLKTPGNADPSLVSHILVDSYGGKTPLKDLASISSSVSCGSPALSIKMYDKELVKSVEKALWDSKLGTVLTSGLSINFQLPPLTLDYLTRVLKTMKEMSEQAKISMRNFRRNTLDKMGSLKKTREDLYRSHESAIQKILDGYTAKIDDLYKMAEKNIKKV